ncbi:aspartyl-phosphate phosphatase Spo0E family protein [Pseudogracilibacillus sp. SO30301A]|uniref:aspartyl-phosphate phosphatase Spo0E family protein n=1 Tax=Pseudogracilibacillus sp. SO30301A TaxID=3098291 RepID=UPI00300E4008
MKSRKELQEEIIFLKRKLIQIGYEKGLNHVSTIQASQKLDGLINKYMKLTQRK